MVEACERFASPWTTRKYFSLKFLYAGTPESSATTLRELVAAGYEFDSVLTREDAPLGRKRVLTPSAVALAAAELGINTIKANRLTDEVRKQLAGRKLDAALVVAYGVLFKQEDLDLLPSGWWNLHFSLLPKHRGAAPVQHALLAGESETGLTLFKIDTGLDTGAILAKLPLKFELGETAGEALHRFSVIGATLLAENIPKIASGILKLEKQNDAEATFAPKINRSQTRVNWHLDSEQIERQVRAYNPEPFAYSSYDGIGIQVISARSVQLGWQPDSGEIGLVKTVGGRVLVGCGNQTSLELLTVKPAGKSSMTAQDWVRGLKAEVRFEA